MGKTQSEQTDEATVVPRPKPTINNCSKPRPSTSQLANIVNSDRPIAQLQPVEKVVKPTGFALYSSFREQIPINYGAPEYVFVDGKLLGDFLQSFPSKQCYSDSLRVSSVYNRGFAKVMDINGSECDFKTTFCMSKFTV